jgi:hypothetical protein
MLVLKIAGGIVLAFILLMVGCSALVASGADEVDKAVNETQTWTVRVVAPAGASWSGAIGDSSVDGVGSRNVTIQEGWVTAATVQKSDGGAWALKLQLVNQGGDVVDESSTSAAYGVATVSGTDL